MDEINAELDTVTINGIEYVKASSMQSSPSPNGNRVVLVVDRGWIFAGDMERVGGRIRLRRALHVFKWSSIGFDGMLKEPLSNNVTLKTLEHEVDVPECAELFCVPVHDEWGLK